MGCDAADLRVDAGYVSLMCVLEVGQVSGQGVDLCSARSDFRLVRLAQRTELSLDRLKTRFKGIRHLCNRERENSVIHKK